MLLAKVCVRKKEVQGAGKEGQKAEEQRDFHVVTKQRVSNSG